MESINNVADFPALKTISYALVAGLGILIAVTTYLNTSGNGINQGELISPSIDLLVVGAIGLAGLTASRIVSAKLLDRATPAQRADDRQAFDTFRTATIVRLILLEFPGIVASIFALITGNNLYLLIALFMAAMMWLAQPKAARFAEWRG